jgi:hypothetical protein
MMYFFLVERKVKETWLLVFSWESGASLACEKPPLFNSHLPVVHATFVISHLAVGFEILV